jgi:hypothetical protein
MTPIKIISGQFVLHNRLFNNVLEDIDDNEGSERMSDQINHLQWIAGHLAGSRYSIAPMLGLNHPFPYIEIYKDATKPPPSNRSLDTSLRYPSLTEIKKIWNDIANAFAENIAKMDNAQLETETPFAVPTGKTFLDLFSFLADHESYHIGQMSIIRKYLGKSAMSYK